MKGQGGGTMAGNVVDKVADIFGQKIGQPFTVVGEDGSKALIKFDYSSGIKRFDGTYWNNAGYFLEHMITGKIRLYKEQGTLF